MSWKSPRALAFLIVAALACGDSTAPKQPTYPAVSGSFAISLLFDNLTQSVANGSGVITISQADREQPSLVGQGSVVITISPSAFTVNTFTDFSVGKDSTVTFRIIAPNPTATWTFTGKLSNTGRFLSGTHTLTITTPPPTTTNTGTWQATKQ